VTILTLSNLCKSFGGLRVVDAVDIAVRRGSRTALIGPNGAGKTTVFNLITGVFPIDQGRVELDGQDITAVPARKRIHYGVSRSFQNIRLMPHLSAVENVMLGQHHNANSLRGLLFPLGLAPRNRWAEAARAALADARLGTYEGQVVATLPYGVQKRIEVVRALMSSPRLLLLDEPAAGLNPAETAELRGMLERVSAGGVTLFVVEHDMHFVRTLCDHVVVLNFGRKIFEGTPEAVHHDRAVLEAYLGAESSDAA
jgi:branched-chain amino acid transport system ATP-binding protein